MGFLSDIKVVDATYGMAGPMLSQVLVDFGADIIRIDRPHAPRSASDLVRLRGSRSIVIDLTREEGLRLVRRLAARADILATEPGLDAREPLGRDYAMLSRENPRLIWCRINGHGDDGPLQDAWSHDHLVAARYGVYDQPGYRPGPTFVTGNIPSLGASLLAFQAIGTALYQREREGHGQEVAVSLLAGALAFQPNMVSASIDPPGGNPPPPIRRPFGAAPFYSIYECADGLYLHFGCLSSQFQRNAIEALKLEAEMEELRFGTPEGRDNLPRIYEVVTARMREQPFREWAAIFEEADVPYAPSQRTEDLIDDPQVAHEGLLVSIQDPRVGPMAQMGPTVLVEGQQWQQPAAAPTPGQHTQEICQSLGMQAPEIAYLFRSGVIE